MYADYRFYSLQVREIWEQELAERMAESRRQALATPRGPSLRARIARRLFALTVAADSKETSGTWFGRGWKREDAYETKLAATSVRT